MILVLVILSNIISGTKSYDPETLCLESKFDSHTVILIDKTNNFNDSQKNTVRNFIKKLRNDLETNEKLSIFILTPNSYIAPIPKFSKCKPALGKEANILYQNPIKIQKKFDDFFENPLDNILSDILKDKESDFSPILEMIQAISLRDDFSNNLYKRKLIIISDMLQHMSKYTHYTNNQSYNDFNKFKKRDYYNDISASLDNVTVSILYILRDDYSHNYQNKQLIFFWEHYFKDMGASLKTVIHVQ